MMRWRIRKLSSQILLAQLAILMVATAVGFLLFATTVRTNLDQDYQARAAAIALSVAQNGSVQDCMASGAPSCQSALQDLATRTAKATGAAYVVLIDTHRVRHTHPHPDLIGQKVSEPLIARDGKVHLGTDSGATGINANARAPLYSTNGVFIGEVSVGITESSVSQEVLAQLPSYAVWFAVTFGIGTIASFGLASLMKRRTFGLELDEIARLLQEREATLHGIREGVIAVDPAGRMSVINDEATRLLHLPDGAVGRRVTDVVPHGPVHDLLTGISPVQDEIILTADHWLVMSRMPVILAGRPHGAVVTFQDRTALEGLARELDGERSFTESLRAQQHEFSNRMHAIAGLLELGHPDEALDFINEVRGTAADLDQTLRTHIGSPQIVGLLLGKAAEAGERGIELVIGDTTRLGEAPFRVQALTTILGNLIDNAFDALEGRPAPRRVRVEVIEAVDAIRVEVSDNGPGIPRRLTNDIFERGFTTRRRSLVRHSGLGLSLVRRAVEQANGTIEVSKGPGATFVVTIPTTTPGVRTTPVTSRVAP